VPASAEVQPMLEQPEPLEPQPAVNPELPVPASAEVQPMLEQCEPLEPQPVVNPELPLPASAEVQPMLEQCEPLEPQPEVNPELPLPASAEVQPMLEQCEPLEPQPAVKPELPVPASAEVQPMLEQREPLEPQPAVNPELPVPASAEVQPILEQCEPLEPQPAVSGNVYTAQKDYDRAIANYNEAIKLDPKSAVIYENRSVTKSKMGDKTGANADLATANAIQARDSGKHVKLGRLADASEKKEAALTPKQESTPEDKSAAKKARAFKGNIGVSIQRVTDGAANTLNVKPARGALVVGSDENGPAKLAGIEPGDVIVKFGDKDVNEWRDLPRIVADTPADKDVAVTIIRKGRELTKTVKVGRLEDADKQASFTSKKGSEPQEKPVAVDPESQVAAKHLASGMVIVEVQQQPVSTAPSLLVPPAPIRFGKRRIDHFSKGSQ
jgi:tetratricopeptide (TPR) repeat protein